MKKTPSTYIVHRIYAVAIALSMLLSFPSCGGGKKDLVTPPEVLTRDSMVQVMASIHIAEAQIQQSGMHSVNQAIKSEVILQTLRSENVDTARFNNSFDWYASHPEFFASIYDDILAEIGRRQSKGR
ncbi:MAG: DUF4296 domain-containing protein [Bacteroidota bacterium]|jgi:hypothetical protein